MLNCLPSVICVFIYFFYLFAQQLCAPYFNQYKNYNNKKGYIVESFRDLTAKQIVSEVWEIQTRPHKDFDSFVLYFSGHGDLNSILGHDLKEVQIGELANRFQPENCSSLQNKPKVKIRKRKKPKFTCVIHFTAQICTIFNEK